LSPAIEARLLGLAEGSAGSFELAAGEAFGPHNPALQQRVARSLLDAQGDLDAEYAVGDVVQFAAPGGGAPFAGVVRAVGDGWLDFDFNHPLAGAPVRFEVEVLGVL
jgi:FKBP-type peptidyl-prolyl cis-trans isomerase SlpA